LDIVHPSIPPRTFFNYIGIAILIAGMTASDLIYWRSLRVSEDEGLTVFDSRVYQQDVQRTIGIFGLFLDQCRRALEEPRPLAITVAVFSMLAAGVCFFTASRMPPD